MISSYEGHTRSWKTFRHRAFNTYHRVKLAINIQISQNRGDVVWKPLLNRVLVILPLVHSQHQLPTLEAFVQLSTDWSIQAPVLHNVVPSTSHAARRQINVIVPFWLRAISHTMSQSLNRWRAKWENYRPPRLPNHSRKETTLWPICHQKSLIFLGTWRQHRPFLRTLGMPNVYQPLRRGQSNFSCKVQPNLVLYSKKW